MDIYRSNDDVAHFLLRNIFSFWGHFAGCCFLLWCVIPVGGTNLTGRDDCLLAKGGLFSLFRIFTLSMIIKLPSLLNDAVAWRQMWDRCQLNLGSFSLPSMYIFDGKWLSWRELWWPRVNSQHDMRSSCISWVVISIDEKPFLFEPYWVWRNLWTTKSRWRQPLINYGSSNTIFWKRDGKTLENRQFIEQKLPMVKWKSSKGFLQGCFNSLI